MRPFPPQPVGFDRSNFFGKHMHAAIVPGWGRVFGADLDTTPTGAVVSVGRRYLFTASTIGDGDGVITDKHIILGSGGGPDLGGARVMDNSDSYAQNHSSRMLNTDDDYGFFRPGQRSLSVVGIVKPQGAGFTEAADSDPRIFSKDEGTGAGDHDLMIGSTGGESVRCRIRHGTSTETVESGTDIQSDALNIISAGIYEASGNTFVFCSHLREDGGFADTAGSGPDSGGYGPRTTTDMAMFSNAGAEANAFDGSIICVYFFDAVIREVDKLRALFYSPWQVFEQPSLIPWHNATAAAAGGLIPLPRYSMINQAVVRSNYW